MEMKIDSQVICVFNAARGEINCILKWMERVEWLGMHQ